MTQISTFLDHSNLQRNQTSYQRCSLKKTGDGRAALIWALCWNVLVHAYKCSSTLSSHTLRTVFYSKFVHALQFQTGKWIQLIQISDDDFLCTIKSTLLNNFVIKPFCISWVFCCHPAVLIVNHESFPSKRAFRHRSNACIQDSVSIIVSKFASTDVRPPGNVGVFYSSDSVKFGESSRILESFDSRIACQISENLADLLAELYFLNIRLSLAILRCHRDGLLASCDGARVVLQYVRVGRADTISGF